jgi:hypothetical protein
MIPRRESAVLGTLTRQMMTGLKQCEPSNDRAGPDHGRDGQRGFAMRQSLADVRFAELMHRNKTYGRK